MKKSILLLPLIALFMSSCGSSEASSISTSKSEEDTSVESTSNESSTSEEKDSSEEVTSKEDSSSEEDTPTSVKCLDIIYSYQSMQILDLDLSYEYTPNEEVNLEANFVSIEEMEKTRLQVNDKFYTFTSDSESPLVGKTTYVVPNEDFVLAFTYYTLYEQDQFKVTFEKSSDYIILGLTSGEITHQKMWFDVYPLKENLKIKTVTYTMDENPSVGSYFTYEYWCMGYSFKTEELTRDITLHVEVEEAKEEMFVEYDLNYGYAETDFIDHDNAIMPSSYKVGRQLILYFPILESANVTWTGVFFEDSEKVEIMDFVIEEYFLFDKVALRMPNERLVVYPCAY